MCTSFKYVFFLILVRDRTIQEHGNEHLVLLIEKTPQTVSTIQLLEWAREIELIEQCTKIWGDAAI